MLSTRGDMSKHLAIFVGNAINKILTGKQTIEARFNREKILPYEAIKKGDEIYLKQSGGLIVGRVTVDNVLFYDHLNSQDIINLKKEYNNNLEATDDFWITKSGCEYASIIFLKNPQRFLTPLKIPKRNRHPWILLEKD